MRSSADWGGGGGGGRGVAQNGEVVEEEEQQDKEEEEQEEGEEEVQPEVIPASLKRGTRDVSKKVKMANAILAILSYT